jgi:hypothetical protein
VDFEGVIWIFKILNDILDMMFETKTTNFKFELNNNYSALFMICPVSKGNNLNITLSLDITLNYSRHEERVGFFWNE